MKLLIQQGRLVDPVGGIGGIMDILIGDGKVTMIGSKIVEDGAEILDASGLVVCAGLVDMHVHLRDPGQTHKEDMEAAAAPRRGEASPRLPAWPTPFRQSTRPHRFAMWQSRRKSGAD
jgi:dihydroorotase